MCKTYFLNLNCIFYCVIKFIQKCQQSVVHIMIYLQYIYVAFLLFYTRYSLLSCGQGATSSNCRGFDHYKQIIVRMFRYYVFCDFFNQNQYNIQSRYIYILYMSEVLSTLKILEELDSDVGYIQDLYMDVNLCVCIHVLC